MSTADFAKAAFGVPSGPHEEQLVRLLNELFRSPAAGLGPGLNWGGPSLGGAGVTPGAVTTVPPKPLFEPQATHTAVPGRPEAISDHGAGSRLPTPSTGGPSAGGVGLTPGAATTLAPAAEPTAAKTAVPSSTASESDPLDLLVAVALSGPAYAGPSLSGIGLAPGIAPAAAPAPGVGEAELPSIGAPALDPLGAGIPGEAELQSLLTPAVAGPSAAARPSSYASPQSFYFLDVSRTAPHGLQTDALGRPGGAAADPAYQSAYPPFDVNLIRRDFPILSEHVNGKPLIWLDNAATTQKPKAVIDRLAYFYEHENSNIHRAAHELAARSTDAYEAARETVARFLGAASTDEIIFVRGATEGINLIAQTYGLKNIGEGDEIVLTNLEHHANIVPWQQLALAKGARLRIAPVDDSGALLLDEFGKLLGPKTRIVAFTQVSNALGTITPVKQIVEMAHRVGAVAVVDGAQAVSHMPVNVQDLDADFYVFSGHKLFAPTGIGAVYGKKSLLDDMPPYQTGGNMISDVTFERSLFHGPPQRFEAGTGNIADAVGLGAAIEYIERIGLENIGRYEHGLLVYATKLLSDIPGLRIIGTAPEKAGVVSFVLKDIPTEEVGARLNDYGIAVRAGHHCAQPILRRFGLEATVRPSFAFYNTCAEVDALAEAVRRIATVRGI